MFGTKISAQNVCAKCGMEFSSQERMLRHMIKAHKRKRFECDSCGFKN